jgi:hypothetical protein
MAEQPAREEKRLIFHLRGGPHGPHIVQSDQNVDTYGVAHGIWKTTMNGFVGRRFDWVDADGVQLRFQIVDRNDAEAEIIITCDYVDTA